MVSKLSLRGLRRVELEENAEFLKQQLMGKKGKDYSTNAASGSPGQEGRWAAAPRVGA